MSVPTHLILRAAACLSAAGLSAGCTSSDARARDALSAYQAAAAANDLTAARTALLELVQAKDDVPDYWVELGKLQASMGSYGDAYYAFTRAYELDRSNVDLLRIITQLALRSGDIGLAQSRARELDVLAPGDPWVKLTKGWTAFSQSRFDAALQEADSLLAVSPFDPTAVVLKARALLSLNREDEAVDLLTKQVNSQPSDVGSLQLLAKIYASHDDWTKVAQVANRLSELRASDQDSARRVVEAGFRSGNVPLAREASFRLLKPGADPALITSVLDLWEAYWPSSQRLQDARRLADAASGLNQKLAYAAFLNRVGSPQDGIRLAAGSAGLPINARNAEANAVLADAWSRGGNLGPAKSRFDAVLLYDPGNATALRGRAELELRTGNAAAAVIDSQKLVTVLPNSASSRLLLARSYAATGNSAWVQRTLWTAFEEIPANERIFAELLATKKGDAEATRELQEEFVRQRDAKVNRGLL